MGEERQGAGNRVDSSVRNRAASVHARLYPYEVHIRSWVVEDRTNDRQHGDWGGCVNASNPAHFMPTFHAHPTPRSGFPRHYVSRGRARSRFSLSMQHAAARAGLQMHCRTRHTHHF